MKTLKISVFALAIMAFGLASCEKEKTNDIEPVVTKVDSLKSTAKGYGEYTLYDFETGKVIDNKDSATAKWDFGIRRTTIIVNGGVSGPGNTGVITKTGSFDNYKIADESGYATDTNERMAIDSRVDEGWYLYDGPPNHGFSPKAGMFFIFKTTEGNYVKLEFTKGWYEEFVGQMPEFLWFKFRYAYQPDGSRNFE